MTDFALNDDEIGIFIEFSLGKRMNLHNLLDKFTDLNQTSFSLKTNNIYPERKLLFKKCYSCGKMALLENYHLGYSENNEDESHTGYCKKCYDDVRWEPTYDGYDDIIMTWHNNIVAFGKYFESWKSKRTTECVTDSDEIKKITDELQKYKFIKIKCPKKKLNGKNFRDYVCGLI